MLESNRPRYDIDQQVEAVLCNAEEYDEHDDEDYEDVNIYSSADEELSDYYSSIDLLVSPTMMCWTKTMLCDIIGQHSTTCMSPCSEM
jgi:hypothetical protein